jgi:hypothetical protein
MRWIAIWLVGCLCSYLAGRAHERRRHMRHVSLDGVPFDDEYGVPVLRVVRGGGND